MTEVLKILRICERKTWILIQLGKLIPDKEINLKDGRKRYMIRIELQRNNTKYDGRDIV